MFDHFSKSTWRKYTKGTLAVGLCVALLLSGSGCIKRPGSGGSSGGGSTYPSGGTGYDAEFDAWLEDQFIDSVDDSTMNMNGMIKDPEAYGIERPEATFGDLDTDFDNALYDYSEFEEAYEEFKEFDPDNMSAEQQLEYRKLARYFDLQNSAKECTYIGTAFGPISGAHNNIPLGFSLMEFFKKQDVEDYMSLLDQTDELMAYYVALEAYRSDHGMGMTDGSIDDAIEDINTFLAEKDNNFLVTTFNRRIDEVNFLTAEEKQAYKEKNKELLFTVVFPAFEDTIDGLNGLRGKGTRQGICAYPTGKESYEYIIKSETGTGKSVEELRKVFEKTLADGQSMVMDVYDSNPVLLNAYYNDEAIAAKGLDSAEDGIAYFQQRMPGYFPEGPEVDLTIRDIDPSIADTLSPAFCVTPYVDDWTHTEIQVNRAEDNGGFGTLAALYAHEGYPGHAYQLSYEAANSSYYGLNQVLNYGGYAEGWATYVELRSYNLVTYDNYDTMDVKNTYVGNEIETLSFYCLADIHINYDGWDEQQLADWMDDLGFNGGAAGGIMDLMVQEPGYYAKYFVGYLEFCELRAHAIDELGDKYHEIDFHKAVLDAGSCDFVTLREEVDRYIESVK